MLWGNVNEAASVQVCVCVCCAATNLDSRAIGQRPESLNRSALAETPSRLLLLL